MIKEILIKKKLSSMKKTFQDVNEKEVKINGQNMVEVEKESLRKLVNILTGCYSVRLGYEKLARRLNWLNGTD